MSSIDELLKAINKKYKQDLIIKGSALKSRTIERATTGSLSFDLMLGGGWPLNQWNELIGLESHGKTTMAIKTIAANQKLNPNYECLWIASEDFNPQWAEQLGMDLDRTLVVETNVTETATQIVLDALEARAVDAVVIDSLPALVSDDELNKEMDEASMTANARLIGKFFRKEGAVGRRSLTEDDRPWLGLCINQWRDNIGVMYGDPRTTPGGKGKNYSFWTRVEVKRDEWVEEEKVKVGIAIKAQTIKNKSYPPRRSGTVDFFFDKAYGLDVGAYDTVKELVNIAMAFDIVTRAGAYYRYDGDQWQGKEAMVLAVRGDLGMQKKIEEEVRRLVLHEA